MTEAPSPPAEGSSQRHIHVADLPIVFLSYDEPWAESCWKDLRATFPDALRVHGVKGLDACHKAAADAAGSDWFITVDADTVVKPEFAAVEIPRWLFQPTLRPTWYSRNAVNGLISGNGSLKLWPSAIVRSMRTHEAAPPDTVSIDHDIEALEAGRTRRVQMPGCYAETDPARTPFHAFRAGLRETVYLGHVLAKLDAQHGKDDNRAIALRRVISTWCTLGRHHQNGLWTLFGARLGTRLGLDPAGWDVRNLNDYGWLETFWRQRIHSRFGAPGTSGRELESHWRTARLEAEVRGQGARLEEQCGIHLAEVGAEESRLVVDAGIEPAVRLPNAVDAIGRAFQIGAGVTPDASVARSYFEEAAAMQYPSAIHNLGRLHEAGTMGASDVAMAERYYEVASALGNRYAPYHLARIIEARKGLTAEDTARIVELDRLSSQRGYAPGRRGTSKAPA